MRKNSGESLRSISKDPRVQKKASQLGHCEVIRSNKGMADSATSASWNLAVQLLGYRQNQAKVRSRPVQGVPKWRSSSAAQSPRLFADYWDTDPEHFWDERRQCSVHFLNQSEVKGVCSWECGGRDGSCDHG